jgi:ParB/RepB/Spo0J family partition protein
MTDQPTTREPSRPDFPAVVHTYTDALRILRERGPSSAAALATATQRVLSNVRRDLTKLIAADVVTVSGDAEGQAIAITDKGLKWVAGQDVAEGLSDEPGSSQAAADGGVIFLTHAQIFPDHANARRDWDSDEAKDELDALRQDILQNGLLQNLVVRADDFGGVIKVETEQGAPVPTYVLVGGERRWRAIGEAIFDGDWDSSRPIPCRLLETDDLGHRLAALAENLQRRNLNPIEKAKAFEGLSKCGLTNKEIADRVSSTPEHVQQHRRFLQLDETDQQRMTLPKDDPRHLSVREARQKLAKKDDAPAPTELSPAEWLALVEAMFAAYEMTEYGNLWNKVVVAPGARDTPEGQRLQVLGVLQFSDIENYGDHIGRFTVKRAYGAPQGVDWCAPGLPEGLHSNREGRIAALRDAQAKVFGADAPVWDDETPTLGTPWLADAGEMTEEGAALVEAARLEAEKRQQDSQDRLAAAAARNAVWAEARQRHMRLLAIAQERPEAGQPDEVMAIAADIERPFPWSALPNGFIVAANGTTVKQPYQYGGPPTDQELAVNQMIVVAANTAAGLATPITAAGEKEGVLDEEAFLQALADAIELNTAVIGGPEPDWLEEAAKVLEAFLAENGVAFGDEGFGWDDEAAGILADAYLDSDGEADEGEAAA